MFMTLLIYLLSTEELPFRKGSNEDLNERRKRKWKILVLVQ